MVNFSFLCSPRENMNVTRSFNLGYVFTKNYFFTIFQYTHFVYLNQFNLPTDKKR